MCPSNERLPMRPAWPEDTVFRRLVLDVERRLLRALRRHPARLRPSFPPHPHPAGPRGVALSPGSLLRLPLPASLPNPPPRRRVGSVLTDTLPQQLDSWLLPSSQQYRRADPLRVCASIKHAPWAISNVPRVTCYRHATLNLRGSSPGRLGHLCGEAENSRSKSAPDSWSSARPARRLTSSVCERQEQGAEQRTSRPRLPRSPDVTSLPGRSTRSLRHPDR